MASSKQAAGGEAPPFYFAASGLSVFFPFS
jgi:hypothetical protein